MPLTPYWQADGLALYHGDALRVLSELPTESIHATITDPPYSSGGMMRADRAMNTAAKYVQSGQIKKWVDFCGDNRDGRSWLAWCSLWMGECLKLTVPGGYFLTFTDWRQLPTATDAVQCAGFVWRGLIGWDKGRSARAPHKGYFRHQCEYIVWGSRGQTKPATWSGPWDGAYHVPVRQADKFHMVGKPTPLLRQLVACAPPATKVLDPFSGSGTTGVACAMEGRDFVGCEADEKYCELAAGRMEKALAERAAAVPASEPPTNEAKLPA